MNSKPKPTQWITDHKGMPLIYTDKYDPVYSLRIWVIPVPQEENID
jgi:hypothetical protein